jgi:TRAP-type C4-dicarboxylate transport system permease small subunit
MGIKRLVAFIDSSTRYWAIAAGWLLLFLTVYITADIVLRKVFQKSIQGSDELGGYILAILCAFGFSWTLKNRAHIRLNLVLNKLPVIAQVMINMFAYIILAAFAYAMLWRGAAMVYETAELNAVAPTPLATPLILPQGIWLLGIIWFSIQLTLYLIQLAVLIVQKKYREFLQEYGVDSD